MKYLQYLILIPATTMALSIWSCKSKEAPEAVSEASGALDVESGTVKKKDRVLTLGAYTTPREAYGTKIIPAFKEYWKKKTGENVEFKESYLGSGAQSRAILGGFEADVAALSLEPDIARLVEAGLVNNDWKSGPTKGMVSRSVVVFGVRKGNPLKIVTWDDLAVPKREVLTPNVKTSGGAMWNIAALWGAALRGQTSVAKGDEKAAQKLLSRVLANVQIMDKGARESMLTFEKGVGDVIITYENEMRVATSAGKDNEYVIPPSTILIENPIAVVNKYAEAHGNLDIANEFVSFVLRPESQEEFAKFGLRPVDDSIANEALKDYPPLKDLFTVRDFGDWAALTPKLFDQGGIYDLAIADSGAAK